MSKFNLTNFPPPEPKDLSEYSLIQFERFIDLSITVWFLEKPGILLDVRLQSFKLVAGMASFALNN